MAYRRIRPPGEQRVTREMLAQRVRDRINAQRLTGRWTVREVRAVMEALEHEFLLALGHGNRIEMRGFLHARAYISRARSARDPRRGRGIRVPSRWRVRIWLGPGVSWMLHGRLNELSPVPEDASHEEPTDPPREDQA